MTPFRAYLCGRKVREGWSACSTGKIKAEGPEEALLKMVDEYALTPEFVTTIVAETNSTLTAEKPSLHGRIEEVQRRLAEVEHSIHVLLDLAGQFGATSAANRLLERETEHSAVFRPSWIACDASRKRGRCLSLRPRHSRHDRTGGP